MDRRVNFAHANTDTMVAPNKATTELAIIPATNVLESESRPSFFSPSSFKFHRHIVAN